MSKRDYTILEHEDEELGQGEMSDLLHWMNVAYKWDKGKTSP